MLEVTSEMSSPQHNGAEISSDSIVVSETGRAAKSHTPDTRRKRKESQQSPFKLPDNNSIFLQSLNRKEDQKEETRKFLALPIDKKTSHAARMMAKPRREEEEKKEEEKATMTNLKQIKSRTVHPKQTAGRHELKMAMIKQENIAKYSKHNLINIKRKMAEVELSLMMKRSEILMMDNAIEKKEKQMKQLEKIIEAKNLSSEEFLRENERKSVEARTIFEQEAKSNQEKNAEIKKLTTEIGAIKSELVKFEEILTDQKRYKELLFKLSPPEWQCAQKSLSDRDAQDKQNGESDIRNGFESEVSVPDREHPSIRETRLSSALSDTLRTSCKLDSDSSEYEDEPELYFTDPQQLLALMTELTNQNLSLIRNSTRVEERLAELRQSLETTGKTVKKDEEQLKLQINDMNQRIDKEKASVAKLRQKVQIHVSLNDEDQDVMLEALGKKVAEVHCCCIDGRMTNLSTLEMLANIENHMSVLLQDLESIPKESLEKMKKIKDKEKRSRQREEKLREQQEKQKERMRRYLERSLADSKKTRGRKLMPRSKPVAQKVRVSDVDNSPTEDDINAYLFTPDDMD